MQLFIAGGGWEDELAPVLFGVLVEAFGEGFFDGDGAFFPGFRVEANFGFGGDVEGVVVEVDVFPGEVDGFLLADAGEEEGLVEGVFPGVARFEELSEFVVRVFLGECCDFCGHVELAGEAGSSLFFEELGGDDHVVDDRVVSEPVVFLEVAHVFFQVFPCNGCCGFPVG